VTTLLHNHDSSEIAIDSRITSDNLILSDSFEKWVRNKYGVFFFTGTVVDRQEVMRLIGKPKPGRVVMEDEYSSSVAGVVAQPNGDVYSFYTGRAGIVFVELSDYNESFGSGAPFALAGLDLGLTTKDAVKYAASRDCNTGGDVVVYDTKNKRFL
jgi:20S proteasome alpha/beta subunit